MDKAIPVYALVGEDSFLQIEALEQIKRELSEDVQRADFDGERADLAEVLDELRSYAMFGSGGKLVVVRSADEFISRFREQLEDYLAKPSSTGTLVLRVPSLPARERIHKAIAKVGKIVPCEPPKQLKPWILERGRSAHKLAIEPDAAELLAEFIGADLARLDSELAKVALQVESGRVTKGDVAGSVTFQREQEIKEMTLELAVGKPAEALRRWRTLVQLDSSAEFRAVTWLTMWLEDVGDILAGGSVQKILWKYSQRVDQFVRFTRLLGRDGHRRAVTALAEMDRRSKSGLGDAVTNVERFLLSFAGD
jgi:DNA polymerase III delta subunit